MIRVHKVDEDKQPVPPTESICPFKSHEVDMILIKLKMEEQKKELEEKIKKV